MKPTWIVFDVLFDQTVAVSIGAKMNIGEISAHEGWTQILARLKKNHIDKVFDSSQEKIKKPDQGFYERVEHNTDAHGKQLFFIDDDKKPRCGSSQRLANFLV